MLTFLLKQHQVLILIQGTPKADPHPLSRVILEIRFGSIFGEMLLFLGNENQIFTSRLAFLRSNGTDVEKIG